MIGNQPLTAFQVNSFAFQSAIWFTLLDGKITTGCYGRSTIVSDMDGVGVALNVDGGSVQELDYDEVRTTEQWINTQGEIASQAKEDG
jgi:hypothetical protein